MKNMKIAILLISLFCTQSGTAYESQNSKCLTLGEVVGTSCRVGNVALEKAALAQFTDDEDAKFVSRRSVDACIQKYSLNSDENSHEFKLTDLDGLFECIAEVPSIVDPDFVNQCFKIPSVHLDHSYISTSASKNIVEAHEESHLNPMCTIHPDYDLEGEKKWKCARKLTLDSEVYRIIFAGPGDFQQLLNCFEAK
ncbi:MAG: hypothetical protein SGJ18_08785 [Pseudomonadota bacterium]|nr:hypothetical protein [Pseudomonadota bacterium]